MGLLVGPQPQPQSSPQSSTSTLTPGPQPSPNPNPSVGPPWRRELPGLPALLEPWLEPRAVSPRADHSCLACCRAPHRSPCVRTSLCCGRPASFGAHEKTAREKCPPQRAAPGVKSRSCRTACGGRLADASWSWRLRWRDRRTAHTRRLAGAPRSGDGRSYLLLVNSGIKN